MPEAYWTQFYLVMMIPTIWTIVAVASQLYHHIDGFDWDKVRYGRYDDDILLYVLKNPHKPHHMPPLVMSIVSLWSASLLLAMLSVQVVVGLLVLLAIVCSPFVGIWYGIERLRQRNIRARKAAEVLGYEE